MTKEELIDKIAKEAKVTKVQAHKAVNAFFDGEEGQFRWVRHLFHIQEKSPYGKESSDGSSHSYRRFKGAEVQTRQTAERCREVRFL
jgi:hypothetical protein